MTNEELQTAIVQTNEMVDCCPSGDERMEVLRKHLAFLLLVQKERAKFIHIKRGC